MIGKVIGSERPYLIHEVIAKGAFSTVYRCENVLTGTSYAMKVMDKKVVEHYQMKDALIREVTAMEKAEGSSSFIVQLADKMVSRNHYYIIMELAEGGTLLDFIRARLGKMGEGKMLINDHHYNNHNHNNDKDNNNNNGGEEDAWLRALCRQLLLGLATLHAKNIVHRDIKPENILLNKDKTRLMISDFGFSCYAVEGTLLRLECGTLKYCAPELLMENPCYDGRKVDIWAAGVTLYLLFFGVHPFPCKKRDPDVLFDVLARTPLRFPANSPPALREMLTAMLALHPAQRPSARELLRCPWLSADDGVEAPLSLPFLSSSSAALFSSFSFSSFSAASLMDPPPTSRPLPRSLSSSESVDDGFYHLNPQAERRESFQDDDDDDKYDDDKYDEKEENKRSEKERARADQKGSSSSSPPGTPSIRSNPTSLRERTPPHSDDGGAPFFSSCSFRISPENAPTGDEKENNEAEEFLVGPRTAYQRLIAEAREVVCFFSFCALLLVILVVQFFLGAVGRRLVEVVEAPLVCLFGGFSGPLKHQHHPKENEKESENGKRENQPRCTTTRGGSRAPYRIPGEDDAPSTPRALFPQTRPWGGEKAPLATAEAKRPNEKEEREESVLKSRMRGVLGRAAYFIIAALPDVLPTQQLRRARDGVFFTPTNPTFFPSLACLNAGPTRTTLVMAPPPLEKDFTSCETEENEEKKKEKEEPRIFSPVVGPSNEKERRFLARRRGAICFTSPKSFNAHKHGGGPHK